MIRVGRILRTAAAGIRRRTAVVSMESSNNVEKPSASEAFGVAAAEQFVKSLATRYGFRTHDFSITWDGGAFDASRDEHELVITSKDGRSAAARIADEALLRRDAWKYLREVDGAFARLSRRALKRGL
jgi:hypothetical protein